MVGGLDKLRAELTVGAGPGGEPARARRLFPIALVVSLLLCACDRSEGRKAELRAIAGSAGPVDSILPMAEALRRFTADLPVVRGLDGGATSRDALVAAFVQAVERNDTAAIRRLHVSRAEYAYLYFPSSIYMNEPYRQPPATAWLLNAGNSDKGVSRVLRRLGGHELEWRGYSCSNEAREGDNSFFRSCTIDYRDPQEGTRVSRRLFGAIIERDSRYKFLSYANDF